MVTPDHLPGEGNGPPEKEARDSFNIAFILLSQTQLPDAEAVVRVFADFAGPGESLRPLADSGKGDARNEITSLEFGTGERSFIALMPTPVPNDEAEQAARFSVSSFGTNWKLPDHQAHLLVTFLYDGALPRKNRMLQFTSLLAAITKASPAVGVYWGNAGATHDPKFFMSVASDQGIMPRIMLWTGVSLAREPDGRASLLSLGMKQLDLPELLLVVGNSSKNSALEFMFDLLAYIADRGAAISEGETVGRTNDERLPVRYVPSPADPSTTVWRVELP